MVHAVLSAATEQSNPLIPATYDIVWSLVCFIVILVFFWMLVLPRMKKMLDERSAAIEGNIVKADTARRDAEAALEQYTAQLSEARGEAGRIRDQAREDGKRILAELKEQASAEAMRITANAHVQIEAERQAAVVSLRGEVGSLAIDLASGVIGESLTDDRRATALVDRFLADLEASDLQTSEQNPPIGKN
jgi:F-type H+-transporting ATPase subunit b